MEGSFFIKQTIIEVIDGRIKYFHGKYRDNYYLYGVITSVNNNGTYNVKVNKDIWTLKADIGKAFVVGNIVMILVPNGDKNNMFIDKLRPW